MKEETNYHSFQADPKKMYDTIKRLVEEMSANELAELSELLEKGIKITINKAGNVVGVDINFKNLVLHSDIEKEYVINMQEKVIFSQNDYGKAKVFKFSNEIRSIDNTFFIRFDFKRDSIYPNYHINAPEDIYGNYHLIPCPYPEWVGDCHTKLDIRKLSPLKSLKIFMLFIKSKIDPICDTKNKQYINILEKGDRI